MSAILSYYREMPQMAPDEHTSEAELSRLRVPFLCVVLRTLILRGRVDEAFDGSIYKGLVTYVPNLPIVYHDTAKHWVYREKTN